MCALRRSRLLFVTTVLALLSAVPMTALPLLHGGDDVACDPLAVIHDSNAHRLVAGTSTAPAEPQHCIICHWSQWARAIQHSATIVAPLSVAALVTTPCTATPRTASRSLSVARAPPLS